MAPLIAADRRKEGAAPDVRNPDGRRIWSAGQRRISLG